jgi:hypothetical protein
MSKWKYEMSLFDMKLVQCDVKSQVQDPISNLIGVCADSRGQSTGDQFLLESTTAALLN